MHTEVETQTFQPLGSDNSILSRRALSKESRPTRENMMSFFRGEFLKPSSDTVCKGNCIYCDSDDDDGGAEVSKV
jgi:hypothetical protein